MVETARVKFFDTRPGKQYGFAKVLDDQGEYTGEEIFFHANDRSYIEEGSETPMFAYRYVIDGPNGTQMLPLPDKTNLIIFERASGKKGDKASPWGFLADWLAVEAGIAHRPSDDIVEEEERCPECGKHTCVCYDESDLMDRWDECQACGKLDCVCYDDRDEEEYVTPAMVRARARAHFGGDTEEAREAASMFPGDFI